MPLIRAIAVSFVCASHCCSTLWVYLVSFVIMSHTKMANPKQTLIFDLLNITCIHALKAILQVVVWNVPNTLSSLITYIAYSVQE